MIKIFVADDHAIVIRGLEMVIGEANDMAVVGHASTTDEVLDRARRGEAWDVLVLDLSMPGAGGLEAIQQLKAMRPELGIVVYTMHPESRYAVRLLRGGASAYLSKKRSPRELVEAIRKVASGGQYVTSSVGELLLRSTSGQEHPHESLTDREFQVLLLLLDGKSTNDIADLLHVSPSTVSTHIRHVREKLGAHSKADLIRYGYRAGLLE